MPRDKLIQYRRGVASLWTSQNPVLAEGESGYETDTKKIKVGDGVTVWNSLDYITEWGSGGGGGSSWGGITGTLSSQTDLQAALDGKAASSHTHSIANVTGLQSALDEKQAAGSYASLFHGHILSDIIDAGTMAAEDAADYYTQSQVDTALSGKQVSLVSGTNIKTVNGISILGSGDLVVSGGGSSNIYGGSAGSVYTADEVIFGGNVNGL